MTGAGKEHAHRVRWHNSPNDDMTSFGVLKAKFTATVNKTVCLVLA